jgi:hypothetical protein
MKCFLCGLLLITPAYANDAVFTCKFANTNEQMTAFGSNGDVRIQWNGGEFQHGTAEYSDPWLVITQVGGNGTFRMMYNTTSRRAYGGTMFFNGKETKSEMFCAFQ